MSVQIPLRRRNESVRAYAVVDDEDSHLATYRWALHPHGYAMRTVRDDAKQRTELLHRAVMRLTPGDGCEIDHIDGDKLNCTRSNLRIVTHAQNMQNRVSHGGTSKFRGVNWRADMKKWRAEIQLNHRRIHVGWFESEDDAARAASTFRALVMSHTNEGRPTNGQ